MNKLSSIKSSIDNLNDNFKTEFFYQSLFNILSELSEENSVSIYSLIETLMEYISKENKELALKDFFKSISLLMHKENVDLFKVLEKFFKLLNKNNQNISLDNMNNILNNINNNLVQIANSSVEFPVPPVSVKIRQNTMNALRGSSPPPPPPPPPDIINNIPVHAPTVSNINKIPVPPPPLHKNVNNLSNINVPLPGQISRTTGTLGDHLRTTNKTSENMNNSQTIKENDCIYPNEIIKYIVPNIADNGKKALSSFATPVEVYQFLKKVDGNKNLENLFDDIYKGKDILSYIYKVQNMIIMKHINLNKIDSFPKDKRLNMKIGEVLVFMRLIDRNNLEKVVKLHEIAKKTQRFEKRNLSKSLTELRAQSNIKQNEEQILFGEFLVTSDIISSEQLNEALSFQVKYNDLMENIK